MAYSHPYRPRTGAEEGATNGLGIAGFVCSLVGLCSGGVLSPVGLILSLIALGKRPRGFAIWGVVLGALGSCGILLALLLVPLVIAGALAAAGLAGFAAVIAGAGGTDIESQFDMAVLSLNTEERIAQSTGGVLPATLDEAAPGVSERLKTDAWGNAYNFELTEGGTKYRLYSAGPDGVPKTADDVVFLTPMKLNNRESSLDTSEPAWLSAPEATPAVPAVPVPPVSGESVPSEPSPSPGETEDAEPAEPVAPEPAPVPAAGEPAEPVPDAPKQPAEPPAAASSER